MLRSGALLPRSSSLGGPAAPAIVLGPGVRSRAGADRRTRRMASPLCNSPRCIGCGSTLASGRDGFGSRCVTSAASRARCPTLVPTRSGRSAAEDDSKRVRAQRLFLLCCSVVRGRTRGGVPQRPLAELIPAGHDRNQKAALVLHFSRASEKPAGWPCCRSPRTTSHAGPRRHPQELGHVVDPGSKRSGAGAVPRPARRRLSIATREDRRACAGCGRSAISTAARRCGRPATRSWNREQEEFLAACETFERAASLLSDCPAQHEQSPRLAARRPRFIACATVMGLWSSWCRSIARARPHCPEQQAPPPSLGSQSGHLGVAPAMKRPRTAASWGRLGRPVSKVEHGALALAPAGTAWTTQPCPTRHSFRDAGQYSAPSPFPRRQSPLLSACRMAPLAIWDLRRPQRRRQSRQQDRRRRTRAR